MKTINTKKNLGYPHNHTITLFEGKLSATTRGAGSEQPVFKFATGETMTAAELRTDLGVQSFMHILGKNIKPLVEGAK